MLRGWAAKWTKTALRVAAAACDAIEERSARATPSTRTVLERALNEDRVEHAKNTCVVRASLLRSLDGVWDLERPFASVTRDDAVALKAAWSETKPKFNSARRWLRHVFGDAIADGRHPGPNPFDRVSPWPERARAVALSTTDVPRVIAAVEVARRKGPRRVGGAEEVHCDALLVILGTGMRGGEVAALRWDEVDLDGATIALKASKTGPRSFPASRGVIDIIRRQRRVKGNPYVFTSKQSRSGHIQPPRDLFKSIKHELGLPSRATLHSLRATWLTHAVRSGRPKELAMKAIGDKSGAIVEKHYLALETEDLRATVEATADELLGGAS